MTRIGIIENDWVDAELLPTFGSYADMVQGWIGEGLKGVTFRRYPAYLGQLPATIEDSDAYILTGSRYSVLDADSWIRELEAFVRAAVERNHPLLGLCFGHQLIAKALGGEVACAESGWNAGSATMHILNRQRWMKPAAAQLRLLAIHKEQVSRLPAGALLLATTAKCPHAMIQYSSAILSIQSHPEHQWKYTAELLNKRKDLLPREVYVDGMKSVKLPTDSSLFAGWVHGFWGGQMARDTP